MANVKTILDTRRTKSNGTYNIIFKATKRKSIYIDATGTINPCSFCHKSYGKVLENDLNSRLEQLVNQDCIEYGKTLLTDIPHCESVLIQLHLLLIKYVRFFPSCNI